MKATLLPILAFVGAACSAPSSLRVPMAESQPAAFRARDSKFDEVDAVFTQFTDTTPGCVVAIAKDGEVLYTRGYGMAVLENDVPLTPDSVLDIGSTAKQITASCIVLLSLEGKLSLDDPIGAHVPELQGELATPTLRQLLNHTSGIRDYIGILYAGGKHFEDWTTADDALNALCKVKILDFPAGSKFAYSNSNYFLMSQVVETVTSSSLREFARARFFGPLGMEHTDFLDNHKKIVKHRAASYVSPTRDTLAVDSSNWEQNGDGGILTTVGDLVLWAENLTSGKVGGLAYVAAMSTRGKLNDGKAIGYGFGLMFDELDGKPLVAHAGAWAGFRADMLRLPNDGLVVVCLSNWAAVNPTILAKRVARIFSAVKTQP